MSSLQFPEDGQVAFLRAFSSWLALLSCSTISHWILAEKDLWSVIRRLALSSPLAIRGAVSGGRGLLVALAGTAETCAAQVGCCSLAVPSPGAGWLGCILASHTGSVPVLQWLQHSQEHEAEPSAYKVRDSPGWLGGSPVKALNLQNLSPALHSSF